MGQMIEFPSNGHTCGGYVATPSAPGPAVVVIQEWWGLVDHIKDVCERFAREGFVALAPDLYHGDAAGMNEPDKAGKLLMGLKIEEAARDMAGAVDHLLARDDVSAGKAGVVGFCAGGNLALQLASIRPVAAAPFYPYPFIPWPDLSKVAGPVQFHIAELDQAPTVAVARDLAAELDKNGVTTEMHVYPGVDHAFFNENRVDVHDAAQAATAWDRVVAFFRANLT